MGDLRYGHELKLQVVYLIQAVKLFKITRSALERLTMDLQRLLGKPRPDELIEKFKPHGGGIFKVIRSEDIEESIQNEQNT
jgi:hypothetical protein